MRYFSPELLCEIKLFTSIFVRVNTPFSTVFTFPDVLEVKSPIPDIPPPCSFTKFQTKLSPRKRKLFQSVEYTVPVSSFQKSGIISVSKASKLPVYAFFRDWLS